MIIETSTEKEIVREDEALFQECAANILQNLNRAIDKQKEPPNKISQLLAMKWYIENGLEEETN